MSVCRKRQQYIGGSSSSAADVYRSEPDVASSIRAIVAMAPEAEPTSQPWWGEFLDDADDPDETLRAYASSLTPVPYTYLRAHATGSKLACRSSSDTTNQTTNTKPQTHMYHV